MKNYFVRTLIFVFCIALTSLAHATPFEVVITFSENDDLFNKEELSGEGWTEVEGDYDTELTQTFQVRKLPWGVSAGSSSFSIDKQGNLSAEYSYGDADGIVAASVPLPKVNGKFIVTDEPCVLALNGGDSASGMWGVDATIEVSILKESPLKTKSAKQKKRVSNPASSKKGKTATKPSDADEYPIHMGGYSKLNEDGQNLADDPSDRSKFRIVGHLINKKGRTISHLEAWLRKYYEPKGLKFWTSRSKGHIVLYGDVGLVTQALAHDSFKSGTVR